MSGTSKIFEYGNQLVIQLANGTKVLAYPTPNNGFYVVGPGPDITGTGGGSLPDWAILVSPLPTSFTGPTVSSGDVTINATQIERMAQTITTGAQIAGVDRNAALVAGIAGMVESSLRNLSNVGSYPETGSLPDIDGDGSDHDSCGIWQMRPDSGWGTPTECCTIDYEVAAFFGGPTGPNNGSPHGLLDLGDWESEYSTPGEAAQAVEVSAYPDRYDNYVPFINALFNVILVNG